MCIAITKAIGEKTLSLETLKICWEENTDGAGFAFNFQNKV